MNYADLHIHSNESDGSATAEELVRLALKADLFAISITDHDTLSALPRAISEARGTGLEIIPGIEMTAQCEGKEIHILGYFLDCNNKELLEKLSLIRNGRVERVYRIVEKLKDMGIDLNPQAVFAISGQASVGRMHIARALVGEGFAVSISEAFNKYIGDKSPAYVLGFKFSPQEVIALIKQAGGVPVLAHPYIIKDDNLIVEFAKAGLMGLEVYYPEHSQSMINFYLEKAKELNLLVTGGTDFHGKAKPDIKLGSIKVPYELVEKIKIASLALLARNDA